MSDFDVSLRLRLVNQLSRPAEEAERDLKDLQKAAEQLGRIKGGSGLAQDLANVGRQADNAKGKIGAIENEANQLRQAIGRTGEGFANLAGDAAKAEKSVQRVKGEADEARRAIGRIGEGFADIGGDAVKAEQSIQQISDKADSARLAIARIGEGFGNFKAEAAAAEAALQGIQSGAAEAKAAIGRIDDGAFSALKSDAQVAKQAIAEIGAEATETQRKLDQLHVRPTGGEPYRATTDGHNPIHRGGRLAAGAEGALDQFGLPIAVGAGGAYMAGALPAGAGVVAGEAIRRSAQDEFTSDQLMVMGGYSEQDQAVYDQLLARIGARKGVGSQSAMNVFGTLMAGGLGDRDAAAMTENAIIFSKATQASPEDAARTTGALRNTFGIGADQMMGAYDAIAIGGKAGDFEVKDIAKHFPSIASKMSALGENGMSGTRLLVALGQAIGKTTGSSDETAVNFENMLGKFRSQDFIKNAKKFGINPEKTLNGAVIEGKSPVLALLQEIKTKVGTDGFKLAKLMPDVQSLAGLEAALAGLEDVTGLMKEMEGNPGAVMQDFVKATDNASSAFDRFSSNVAAKAKFLAAYALPPLKDAMNAVSDTMEGDRDADQLTAPEGASGETQQAIAEASDRGARLNRFFESLFGWEKSKSSKHVDMVDAYQEYARTRMEGERGAPSPWARFWFGEAAEPGFSLKDHMEIGTPEQGGSGPWDEESDSEPQSNNLGVSTGRIPVPLARPAALGQAAEASMDSYNAALSAGGEKATAEAMSIADRIKAALGFTVSPTISPTYIQPSTGGVTPSTGEDASGKQTSLQHSQSNNVKLTQHIYSPNAKTAALRAQREQNRSVRMAQSRRLGDIGPRLA